MSPSRQGSGLKCHLLPRMGPLEGGQVGPPWVFPGCLLWARARGELGLGPVWLKASHQGSRETIMAVFTEFVVYTACRGAMLRTLPVQGLWSSQLLFYGRKNKAQTDKVTGLGSHS